ncbi:MAG: carotenoid 1,2-hydratase [Ramlibacter sp.]|nr:carotenoid 1,2-hydratase [Ramlibacter sp.]
MRRREFSVALSALALASGRDAFALPAMKLDFPRDHGAHPGLRTEWWYITGQARSANREFGFQVTFFRSRIEGTQGMTSRFAAKQIVFAHAALTDVEGRELLHDQRIARAGFDVAETQEGDARVRLRDWSLDRSAGGYAARVSSHDFALDLRCATTQPLLLQGKDGLSRKGPQTSQASYYYSEPQLAVAGNIVLRGQRLSIEGKAWLDHEWSDELLHSDAVGWDWIGMNLDDGSALTAFRLRKQDGSTIWDGGSFRANGGNTYVFSPGEAVFSPQRKWTSPMSGATYPVEWIVRTPADFYTVKALVDNQELDSRASTGSIYWEGLSELFDSNGKRVGRGYLEMTGYSQRLRM